MTVEEALILKIQSALRGYSLSNDEEVLGAFLEFREANHPMEIILEAFRKSGFDVEKIIREQKYKKTSKKQNNSSGLKISREERQEAMNILLKMAFEKDGEGEKIMSPTRNNFKIDFGKLAAFLYLESTNEEGKLSINKLIFLISEYIINNFDLMTFQDTEEIFIYYNGMYQARGDKMLSVFIQKLLKEDNKISRVNEILGHIRRMSYKNREKIIEEKYKICLENGILDLETLEVIPHTPELIFFNKIPVEYNKNADCPNIKKFFGEVLNKEDILIAQEIAGYCLLKDYPIHKAFMFVGGGANGKSTLIKLLKSFIGQENCASVPLQHLEMDKFALSSLFGKLANLFADLPARALKETSIFKMLTGEDFIPAEKKFKDKFFFTNYAKQIFSCNQVPRSPDDSDAFFRRWVILNFPNQFLNNNADKNLIQKLTTPEELSGFLNFAIEGYKRLIEEGDFSNTKSVERVREDYIRMSDSVGAFIMDCITISSDDYEIKKSLYVAYADYCRKNKYPIIPENTFHRELQKQVRVEDYKPLLDVEGKKQRVYCWRGIKTTINRVKNPDNLDNLDTKQEEKEENVQDVQDVYDKNPIKYKNKSCVSCGKTNTVVFPNGKIHCRDCGHNEPPSYDLDSIQIIREGDDGGGGSVNAD